jgi:hypothetical protein
MFLLFEEYTEWISKGKSRPNVELGKKIINHYRSIWVDNRLSHYGK